MGVVGITSGLEAEGTSAMKGLRRPGARQMRLEQIRKEIEQGTYETEGKLRIAITRLIDEVLGRRPGRRR